MSHPIIWRVKLSRIVFIPFMAIAQVQLPIASAFGGLRPASPPTRALPLDPAGDFYPPDPLLCPPAYVYFPHGFADGN